MGESRTPQEARPGRPLYLLVEESKHDFLDAECRRRRMPGRAPLHKAVIVREALNVYQKLVGIGLRLAENPEDAETRKELDLLVAEVVDVLPVRRPRFDTSKEVDGE